MFKISQICAIKLVLVLSFFIYIPVAFFKSSVFLLALDLILLSGVTSYLFGIGKVRILKLHVPVYLLLFFYVFFVFLTLLFNSDFAESRTITQYRNNVFGVGIFVLASSYLKTTQSVDSILKTVVVCAAFAALNGLRQFAFGYFPFELERLAIMGASLREYQVLGRLRISTTFGDPLLSGFMMFVSMYFLFALQQIRKRSVLSKSLQIPLFLAFLFCLATSLTRAPLLGAILGALAYVFSLSRLTYRAIKQIIFSLVLSVFLILGLNFIVASNYLASLSSPIFSQINSALFSVWSLISMFFGGAETRDNLVNYSKNLRMEAWSKALNYISKNPLGTGFIENPGLDFSPGDVGFLKVALIQGLPAALFLYGVFFLVTAQGFFNIVATRNLQSRKMIAIFWSLWIGILATNGVSFVLDNAVAATVTWIVAAIIVNGRTIFTPRDPLNESLLYYN